MLTRMNGGDKVLDESTASIDGDTDNKIQETIRREFRETTCIVIAHRIQTVIDSDMIVVMQGGRVVEYDKPGVLLADPRSVFHSMAQAL